MRGDGRIYRRPNSPYWWAEYYLRGECHRESTEKTNEDDAKKYLRLRMKHVWADQIGKGQFAGPKQERVRVNQILDDLESDYKRGGKKQIPRELSAPMKSQINRLREFFGTMPAMQVHRRDVDDFISELRREKKQNATINRFLQLLAQAYKVAVNADPQVLSRPLIVPKLDESDNIRKGKFSPAEAEAVANSLPKHMADVARFGYETGSRAGEILKLRWTYLEEDVISIPAKDCKNRKPRKIAMTPKLEAIIERRRKLKVPTCPYIFHHNGEQITDYRDCWHTACVVNGLGRWYCRDCRDEDGNLTSVLDATKHCPKCGKHWTWPREPKYVGRIFHDFRRSAAHELWLAGNTEDDCREVTGHSTVNMFRRYKDLFSDEEKLAAQRKTQERRREWQMTQAEVNLRVQ